jgi:hypothetical protein
VVHPFDHGGSPSSSSGPSWPLVSLGRSERHILVLTEQGAYFEGGDAANAEREAGTIGLLKQLEATL